MILSAAFLPKLHTLILTNNRLVNLVDLEPLAGIPNLHTLCLLDNIVTKREHYRLYVIHKLPRLRLLDFKKVKFKVKTSVHLCFPSLGPILHGTTW